MRNKEGMKISIEEMLEVLSALKEDGFKEILVTIYDPENDIFGEEGYVEAIKFISVFYETLSKTVYSKGEYMNKQKTLSLEEKLVELQIHLKAM